jgi:ubiquinone/menaquinone biosynthesis C-methylase UbiE
MRTPSEGKYQARSPLSEPPEGGLLRQTIAHFRTASRLSRAALFCSRFDLRPATRILDLGGGDGIHIHSILADTPVSPSNVYVADIDHEAVESAGARFGYRTVFLSGNAELPFPDNFFDVVFCSSVLEHVALPGEDVWREKSGRQFRNCAKKRQRQLAREISRVATGYFVQVPHRWFPVETHTWLPFLSYVPRGLQCCLMGISNRFWIKESIPDFYLPTAGEMAEYFPDAQIRRERIWGITKSLIAVRDSAAPVG